MSQALSTDTKNRLQCALVALRLGVFIVMFMWTMDKFVNNKGQELTLDQLKAKYPSSWAKADG